MTLKEFLQSKMKMSGLYQPVIIKHLLMGNGIAKLEDIAKELATLDRDAVEDYIQKLKVHPKNVLKKHGIAEIQKDVYHLLMELGDSKEALINICEKKISDFVEQAGDIPGRPSGWGAKRVQLLTDHPYCNLCGARPAGDNGVELDIDHIEPASLGGSDDITNLQVLCARCNRAKGNQFLTSAKIVHNKHINAQSECIFCNLNSDRIKYQDDYILLIEDAFPVTNGHTLILPVRHCANALELHDIEMVRIFKKAQEVSKQIQSEDATVLGFNMGFNVGRTAGQTVDHCHFHIIPRREGDVSDPIGGIRNIIPGKGKYKNS